MKQHHLRLLFFIVFIVIHGCKKEEAVTNTAAPADAKMFGKVYCDTYPAGAQIFIDSVNTGKVTPSLIDSLTEGIHAVGFKRTFFSDTVTVAQVRINSIPVARCTLKQTVNISNYFPLTVGSSWHYERTDTGGGKYVDSTSFTVADMRLLYNGAMAVLWIEKSPLTVDSLLVSSSNDTVRFYSAPYQSGFNRRTFIFPLTSGKTWSAPVRSYTVDTIETVTTKAGVFTNCFRIQEIIGIPNTYGHPTYWIHPVAGIVKVYDYDFLERRYEIWNLKSYYIAPK
ncbi:MAG: PEGA domain-containing protein [Bacteroidota bacterium]